MPKFRAKRRVQHSANDMFDLVTDLDSYPEFVPLCKTLRVRNRMMVGNGIEVATASMTVAYKMFHETFTTRVTMNRPELKIAVEYISGPLQVLANRWGFRPLGEATSEVEFMIDYEFRSRMLGALMGAVFDRAFRHFAVAFEKRADEIYGTDGNHAAQLVSAE